MKNKRIKAGGTHVPGEAQHPSEAEVRKLVHGGWAFVTPTTYVDEPDWSEYDDDGSEPAGYLPGR